MKYSRIMSSTDQKLSKIDEKIREIDCEIGKLIVLKKKLIEGREQLKDKKFLDKQKELQNNDWSEQSFPWSEKVRENLESTFGIKEFRCQQLETINVTMSRIDVILVAPTGGGKSLCYQLPAICESGITLVVSPLISLMEDQLFSLTKKNIKAEVLSSTSEKETVNRVHDILKDSSKSNRMKLLYVTPERLAKSKRLMSALQKCYENKNLARIAIDEVHCCSVLGHDFRPDYKFLGTMKTLFPDTPLLGVTATASRKILVDIQKILNIRGCMILTTPFNRPNLFYGLLEKPSNSEETVELLAGLLKNRYKNQSGIIYTFSIKDAETLANELLQEEINVRAYHADLTPAQRSKVYTKWMNNEIQAVVATIAFGMGIDKPDVRFVIHHTLSKSMENFYQESGRCGRDGNYAECILLFRFADMFKISSMTFAETNGLKNTYSVINYCINPTKCRRDLFSNYFTEVWSEESCGKMCDHCFDFQHRKFTPPKVDILPHYHTLMKILDKAHNMDTKMTALKLIDAWFCKGPAKLRLDAAPPKMDRSYAEKIIAFLIIEDYLREDIHYTPYSTISYIKCGHRTPPDGDLEFQASSVQKLPKFNEIREFYESVAKEMDSQAVVRPRLAALNGTSPRKGKRKISLDTISSDDDGNISMSSAALEKLIEQKVESKMKKFLGDKNESSSSKDLENDVILVPSVKPEVIEIDDD